MRSKLYKAMVSNDHQPAQRVSVLAGSLDEAKKSLEAQYGKGNVFDLHSEEDAARPR